MKTVHDAESVAAAVKRAERQSNTDELTPQAPITAERHSSLNPAVETPVEGRQGFLGRPVLAVLVGGLILVGLAWIVVHYAT